MNRTTEVSTIVLIAVEADMYEYLDEFVGKKYKLFAVDKIDDFKILSTLINIHLFMIGTDKPWLGTQDLIKRIKESPFFQNIPIIGLALKKHYAKMTPTERYKLEDILLLPCGGEDLLTRIEVWTRTYDIMCQNSNKTATYSLDDIKRS
jgi:hypothetical protein